MKAGFYILTSQTNNKVGLAWWAEKIKILLWHVWHDCQMEQNVLPTPENKNSDVVVQNKYKEPKEIYPSESKYLHTIRDESSDMEIPGGKHHKEYWGPTVLFIRHPRWVFFFFLVSEYKISKDTLNCWQE